MYGSDMLRYFLLSSPITRGDFTNFSYNYLLDTKKEFFNTLWNSYRYFVTYANLNDFKYEENLINSDEGRILDRWILIRLNEVIHKMSGFLEKYEVMYAVRELAPFVSDLSNWYIRRSRDLISDGNKVSLNILYHTLVEVSKLMAPFMPLLSESIYKNLTGNESVHLEDYPEHKAGIDKEHKKILNEMELAREISSAGNSIRKMNNIPVRQPLSKALYKNDNVLDKEFIDLIKDEINVKDVKKLGGNDKTEGLLQFKDQNLEVFLDQIITKELLVEMYSRELIREIQKLRKDEGVEWDSKIRIEIPDKAEYKEALKLYEKKIIKKTLCESITFGKSFKITSK